MRKGLAICLLLLMYIMPVSALEQGDANVNLSIEPEPKVGTPSELRMLVTNATTGEPIGDVYISVEILIVEEGVRLFLGDFYSPDGTLEMLYHFQDASEHAINLKISPAGNTKQATKTFLVDVELPDPPTQVWFKTWMFLMGVLILGIAAGFFAVKLKSRV